MPQTGLAVPANAEIAFEGFIHPNDELPEGPLGEWTGYYPSGKMVEGPSARFLAHVLINRSIMSASG